jgi:uncharacterized protein RhaS with RHS repeats
MGSFISEDPAGLLGGQLTLYGYVGGDPLNVVDPTGLAGGNSGERGWSGGAGGTNNPGKHWKDDPKKPGWGWQKNPQTGKSTYKKKPPYLCPGDSGDQKMDPFESLDPQMYPGEYGPSAEPWTSGGYSPDGEAMPSSNPGFSPGPAAKAITVGGVLIIVVVIILLPVGI